MRPNSRPCCRPQKFVSYPLSLILSIIYLCIGLILFVFIWVHSILILAQLSPNFPYPCVRTNPSHPFVFLIFTIHSKSQTLKALKDLLFFPILSSTPSPFLLLLRFLSFPFFFLIFYHLHTPPLRSESRETHFRRFINSHIPRTCSQTSLSHR